MKTVRRNSVPIVAVYHEYRDETDTTLSFVEWMKEVHGGSYDQEFNLISFENDSDATAFLMKYGI
jgi:hypothetical protein